MERPAVSKTLDKKSGIPMAIEDDGCCHCGLISSFVFCHRRFDSLD
jgi:hypothetical protein